MSAWPSRLLVLASALFLGGWALVLASGHGGDSAGGSELVWRIGGLMVYGSFPALLIAAALGLIRTGRP